MISSFLALIKLSEYFQTLVLMPIARNPFYVNEQSSSIEFFNKWISSENNTYFNGNNSITNKKHYL